MSIAEATTAARDQNVPRGSTLHEQVRLNAQRDPLGAAFITATGRSSWREYDALADTIAATLVALGLERGSRVAVQLPDNMLVHAALVATARAGLVAVGIGARAGDHETAHLLRKTTACTLITLERRKDESTRQQVHRLQQAGVDLEFHMVLSLDGVEAIHHVPTSSTVTPTRATRGEVSSRSLEPDDLCLLNSTSGTTGLPKCVTQFDSRWFAFSRLAIEAGGLTADDVFLGAVPAPFGFGLWTSHYTPTLLGSPTVVMPRFDVDEMIDLIEGERVSILSCVSTQFRLLLNSPRVSTADLSSLRVMFTGGEAVPADRAAEFEERVGATVLQFFGSNETGALSCTTLEDPREKRLTTAGRLIPGMQVRIFDEHRRDISHSGGPGQPAGKGPLTCRGYYEDDAANAELFTDDGWMLMGDLVRLDEDGYLSVIGRTSDIVIRGGKNISAVQVEQEVETHPAVDLAAVVAVPDAMFGERVCAVVVLRTGQLALPELIAHLRQRHVSAELFPEHLVVVDTLPRASGGKLSKTAIRDLAIASLGASAQGVPEM